jgi:hypothetical protein
MGHGGMHDPVRFELYHCKDVAGSKQPIIGRGKVARPYIHGVILRKGGPGLVRRYRFPYLRYVFLYGPFTHGIPRFRSSPRIRSAHHNWFSFAILQMRSIVSGEIFGLFLLPFDFNRQ